MKKLFVLPLAALALAACENTSNSFLTAPDGANFQLVDETLRRTTGNAEVVATFSVEITGGTTTRQAGSPGINAEGQEVGTCFEGGRWQNPSNKKFAAKVPHDHCVMVAPSRMISLEPITSSITYDQRLGMSANTATEIFFSNLNASNYTVKWHSQSGMSGSGLINAIAVDQDGNAHGSFEFNLAEFGTGNTLGNLFQTYEDETENGGVENFGLHKEITATYFNPDGTTMPVKGYLIWVK
jgi:hypothetical protein